MFISRLEMSGFKSFASKSSIDFRAGVMAVVGPNGCGKSNIVDAVRWVLGEQRTHALRADKMEAVIFNGAAKRRPVGMAEVILTIENDKGVLPSPYTQVELARRLSRSGDSEYSINRTPTRLRDVQELFADTGFSHSAYSIIELPMVEGIINGPAESRRSLFEEAAGVSKFKSRRIAAERRLENTRESLDRLKDVYGEVEKSYQALKRQSGKAKRYQSLSRALQLRLLADLSKERLDISGRRGPTEERLRALEGELAGAEGQSVKLSSELLKLEADDLMLEGKVSRAMESLKRIERREAELDGELALVKQRQAHLAGELGDADRRRGELKNAIERSTRIEAETTTESEALAKQLAEKEADKKRLEGEAKRLGEETQEARRKLEVLRNAQSELERQIAATGDAIRRNRVERERLAGAIASVKKRKSDLELAAGQLTSRIGQLESSAKSHRESVQEKRSERERLTGEVETARKSLAEAHGDAARLGAASEAAKGSLSAHRSREGSSAGLPKALRQAAGDKRLIALAERIDCLPEHRAAVAAALRPLLDAVDRDSIEELLALAGKFEKGEAAALRFPGVSRTGVRPPLPERVNAVAGPDLIAGEGELADFLRARLGDLVLVENRQALGSLSVWAATHRVRLATSEGELLEPDGVLYAGRIDPEAYRVGWQKKLGELERKASEALAAHQAAQTALKSRTDELTALEKRLSDSRRSYQQIEDELATTERGLAGAKGDLEQNKARAKEAVAEEERLLRELSTIPEATPEANLAEQELAGRLQNAKAEREQAQSEVQRLESAFLKTSDDRAAASGAAASLTERLTTAKNRREGAIREAASATQRLAEMEARLATAEAEQGRSVQAGENITAQLDLVRKEKQEVTTALDAAKGQRAEVVANKQQVSGAVKKAQDLQKHLTAEQGKLETDAVTYRERLRELDRRLTEDAGANPATITERTPEQAEAEIAELGLAEVSHEQLKVRIQALGPVNMLALEELTQVEERYRFLTDQRKDLEGGIELLTETIDRINHEARRRFRETFDQVDANFQNLFRTLFEGGEARITLESGDPLEADIRIWATPSGKKMQGLGMLSGGEKALTAISLLFAVYLVRPSPFCILDEVDAPLDDANVARFNRLIRQFSKETQFLIVTHNKRTMEAADSLIGVTLADDGTSQLVSVRLETNGIATSTGNDNDGNT